MLYGILLGGKKVDPGQNITKNFLFIFLTYVFLLYLFVPIYVKNLWVYFYPP